MHLLITLVNNAVPSMGVSGAHHLFLLLSDPLSAGTAHFAILALPLEMSSQVCDKVSFETPSDHFSFGEAHLVRLCLVPFKEPRADLQLIAWLASQWISLVVVHLVSLRQREVARTGFGAWLIRQKLPRVRVFPALVGFGLDAISVTEQDLRTRKRKILFAVCAVEELILTKSSLFSYFPADVTSWLIAPMPWNVLTRWSTLY
jgi:hypothetical protein